MKGVAAGHRAMALQAWRDARRSMRPMVLPKTTARLRPRIFSVMAGVLTGALLAACGGGLSIGIGIDGDFDFSPPSVSLVAAQGSVLAGQSVKLSAAAADESGIESVAFYRLDGNAAVFLGTDRSEPFEWQAFAPTDGRDRLLVFARATDGAGNQADSASVEVVVTP